MRQDGSVIDPCIYTYVNLPYELCVAILKEAKHIVASANM